MKGDLSLTAGILFLRSPLSASDRTMQGQCVDNLTTLKDQSSPPETSRANESQQVGEGSPVFSTIQAAGHCLQRLGEKVGHFFIWVSLSVVYSYENRCNTTSVKTKHMPSRRP